MFSKKSIILLVSSLTWLSLVSARTEYSESVSVNSDINDSWVVVDYPASAGNVSTTRGNVVVSVEKNVSVTADYLNVYGTGSSIVFLGNNEVNAGSISLFGGAGAKGSSIEFYNSTITADQINLRDSGTSLLVKNSHATISGKLLVNTGAEIVVDGGSIAADSFSQTGTSSKDTSADIKILNGGSLILNGEGVFYAKQGHNIYVDSTSSFTSSSAESYYGTLTFEAGANISLSSGISLANTSFELVVDDISSMTDKELNSYFETITLAGNSIENLITSENLKVYDKTSGISFDVSVSDSGIINVVPEPSTYAMILGAIALAFAAYRRRK